MARMGSALMASAVLRIERVPQAVAEEVQRKKRGRQEDRREDQEPVADGMFLAPSEISTPQLAIGSCTPRPR